MNLAVDLFNLLMRGENVTHLPPFSLRVSSSSCARPGPAPGDGAGARTTHASQDPADGMRVAGQKEDQLQRKRDQGLLSNSSTTRAHGRRTSTNALLAAGALRAA